MTGGIKRTLYVAIGFWLARRLFRRQRLVIDPVTRMRCAGF
jgi:hypothetical protein